MKKFVAILALVAGFSVAAYAGNCMPVTGGTGSMNSAPAPDTAADPDAVNSGAAPDVDAVKPSAPDVDAVKNPAATDMNNAKGAAAGSDMDNMKTEEPQS